MPNTHPPDLPMPAATTAFHPRPNGERSRHEGCHGGVGPFLSYDLLGRPPRDGHLQFLHDNIIPPGSTFGMHHHDRPADMEEWYYCLEGEGVLILDGHEHPFRPGDLGVCRSGGSHGLRNDGTQQLRVLVMMLWSARTTRLP